MLYRTLGELRAELAIRLGFGATGSAGINAPILNSFLRNGQEQLFSQFDWLGQIKYDEKTTGLGQTLYDWADDCSPLRVREIAVNDSSIWRPMTEGITWDMRSSVQYGSVPTRFERFQQMEIWPEPDDRYVIRRYYVASPSRFTQDNDRATIDDSLVLLHAIANAKLHYKQPDGETYGNQLQAMMSRLKSQNRRNVVYSRNPAEGVLRRPKAV